MEPLVLGTKYDKIAQWWSDRHFNSDYGIRQFEKALNFAPKDPPRTRKALDVGCGAGGRFVRILQEHGFSITGIDVSKEMIKLAKLHHPNETFYLQDICTWELDQTFDFIVAWDSIFHLPFAMQESVVAKLCNLLATEGVLIYTFGDAYGEHDDQWHNDTFHYSSIGINRNLEILAKNGVLCKHLELDQWPQNHVFIIGIKP